MKLIWSYLKKFKKKLISKSVNEEKYLDAYILLKGYYYYSKDNEVLKKLLLVGENIREKDKDFGEVLLDDIEYCEKNKIKINTNMAPIEIKGNNFEILYIATSTLIISGYFDYIGYGEWCLIYGRDKKRENKSWNTSKRYREDT